MTEKKLLNEGNQLARVSLNRSPNVEAEIKRCHTIMNIGAGVVMMGLSIILYLLFASEYSNWSFWVFGFFMTMGGLRLASEADWRLKMYKVSLYTKSLEKNKKEA